MEKDTRRLALASVVAGIGAVTLIPVQAGWREHPHLPVPAAFLAGSRWFSWFDAGQNILLFLPLGILIGLKGPRERAWLRGGAAGFALSASIECAQTFLPGRFASVWDIVFNALGAALGAWIASRSRQVTLDARSAGPTGDPRAGATR